MGIENIAKTLSAELNQRVAGEDGIACDFRVKNTPMAAKAGQRGGRLSQSTDIRPYAPRRSPT
jgi:hypothetical protein